MKDGEGNTSNPANVHIDYDAQPPVATNNEAWPTSRTCDAAGDHRRRRLRRGQ
ncbi:MAG: hypothetical protein IPL49_17315 [Saprospirales bacterium]|nr:hypothetical protein [Saprospirales bacterium]